MLLEIFGVELVVSLVIPFYFQGLPALKCSPVIISYNGNGIITVFAHHPSRFNNLHYAFYLHGICIIIADQFAAKYRAALY